MRFSKLALALCIGSIFIAASAFANSLNAGPGAEMVPSGKGYGIQGNSQAHEYANPHKGGGGNGISYHGGPGILRTTNVHFIWDGQSRWPNSTQKSILED